MQPDAQLAVHQKRNQFSSAGSASLESKMTCCRPIIRSSARAAAAHSAAAIRRLPGLLLSENKKINVMTAIPLLARVHFIAGIVRSVPHGFDDETVMLSAQIDYNYYFRQFRAVPPHTWKWRRSRCEEMGSLATFQQEENWLCANRRDNRILASLTAAHRDL